MVGKRFKAGDMFIPEVLLMELKGNEETQAMHLGVIGKSM